MERGDDWGDRVVSRLIEATTKEIQRWAAFPDKHRLSLLRFAYLMGVMQGIQEQRTDPEGARDVDRYIKEVLGHGREKHTWVGV